MQIKKLVITLLLLLILVPSVKAQEPTPIPTPATTSTFKGTEEEQAIQKVVRANNPLVIEDVKKAEPNLLQRIAGFLSQILGGKVLFQEPKEKDLMYVQSEQLQDATIPPEVQYQGEGLDKFESNLGDKTGYWSAHYPQLKTEDSSETGPEIKDFERAEEAALFPPCVHPVTPDPDNCK